MSTLQPVYQVNYQPQGYPSYANHHLGFVNHLHGGGMMTNPSASVIDSTVRTKPKEILLVPPHLQPKKSLRLPEPPKLMFGLQPPQVLPIMGSYYPAGQVPTFYRQRETEDPMRVQERTPPSPVKSGEPVMMNPQSPYIQKDKVDDMDSPYLVIGEEKTEEQVEGLVSDYDAVEPVVEKEETKEADIQVVSIHENEDIRDATNVTTDINDLDDEKTGRVEVKRSLNLKGGSVRKPQVRRYKAYDEL
eukprot:TRINITY_DN2314_c0_g1_i1.p1 TRINITY_DN2314_c0_g1~~TRINITY_DN2314_c0_g1_i1.p1  ORF type:complete len:246 (+),score=47.25 TRINITY_DN2314_c0_g1_i1:87-824(+)